MSIIKLNPGQKIQFTAESVMTVEGNYGPQLKFTGSTPDDESAVLFLNVDTATKQLGRIGFTPDSVIGSTVEVEKVEKNGTKYTNINRASGAVPAPRPNAKAGHSSGGPLPWEQQPVAPIQEPEYGDVPAQQAAVDALKANKLDGLFTLYRTCLTEAVSASKAIPNATPEAIAAMTATIFIAAQNRGLAA